MYHACYVEQTNLISITRISLHDLLYAQQPKLYIPLICDV